MKNKRLARAIAFYLPQYHPVPANDKFWGKGFTEWTNVTKAKPLYKGHVQPKLPADLGFYDLRVHETREQQALLAQEAGIEAFCYWHYWFGNGERVLDRVINEVLQKNKPDISFCLGWANESWTGRWHGLDNKIIFKQSYPGEQDYIEHFSSILPILKDKRYIKINGRPLFLIYKPNDLPNKSSFLQLWNKLALHNSVEPLYFVAVCDNFEQNEMFDGVLRSSLVSGIPRASKNIFQILSPYSPKDIYNYEQIVEIRLKQGFHKKEIPLIIPNWDNTPRSGKNGRIFQKSSPEYYAHWLKSAINMVNNRKFEERIIFIKSWNEWAEGNYLEPDKVFGKKYLDATKQAIFSIY